LPGGRQLRPIAALEKNFAIAVAKLVRLYEMAVRHNLANRRSPDRFPARPANQFIPRESYMLDQHVGIAMDCGFFDQ